MSMIDRYRKKGGFVQLLNLIETSGKEKQEKFLKLIGEESSAWETEIRNKMISIDKVMSWDPTYLQEIFPHIQPLTLAMIVGGLPPDKATVFTNLLTFKEKKGVQDLLQTKTPTPAETGVSIAKFFSEIRKMVAEGSLKFEKFAPEMVVPEDIEAQLGSAKGVSTTLQNQSLGIAPTPAPSGPASSPISSAPIAAGNAADEIGALRKKLVSLSQENQRLQQENIALRNKLEQIRKIS